MINDRFVGSDCCDSLCFLFAFESEGRNRSVSTKEYIVNSDSLKEEFNMKSVIDSLTAMLSVEAMWCHIIHHVISYHATSLLFI